MQGEENKNRILPENIENFLNDYTESLLQELISIGLIKEINHPDGTRDEPAYELTSTSRDSVVVEEGIQSKAASQAQAYYDFRNLLRSVYYYLKLSDSENARTTSIFKILSSIQILEITQIRSILLEKVL